jgi:hypothetical protein
MKNLSKEQVLGVIRHTLTFAGGIILAQGFVDQATLDTIIGSAITLIGAIWSVLSKRKA